MRRNYLTRWKPLPELTSLPISSSLGLRCGSGKSSLLNCSIVSQLNNSHHFTNDLMQALSTYMQLSYCGVFLMSVMHALMLGTGVWAICTRHDVMTAVHRGMTCLLKADCGHLSAQMVKTEGHAGRLALSQDLVASAATDCIMRLRAGPVQSDDSIMPCAYSTKQSGQE